MKLTLLLLTAAIVNVSAKGLSQTVSFSEKNTSLQEVLSAVKKQTGFAIVYNAGLLQRANPVSLNVTAIPLEDFLNRVFQDQPLDYSIENNTIFISRKIDKTQKVDLGLKGETLLPPGNIQGRVTGEDGEPLAGASITVKRIDGQGASTDAKGYYTIQNISAGEYTLEVSYVGYSTKSTAIKVKENGTVVLNFSLTPSLVNLDQLTVTSTLSARKIREYPGTIAVIKQEDLKNRNLNNIASVLESVPGIIITPGSEAQNSGIYRQPGNVLIRGTNAGAQIKYLIDGVDIVAAGSAISILQTLDLNDIEKLEILKGPMASTLYGSGAAGGIISITTKKGKSGKAHVNFKTMFTQYANDYADYSGYNENYSLNVSGGNEQFNYLLGAGYNKYPTPKLSDTSNGINDNTWSYNARIGGKVKNIAADLSLQYGYERSGTGSIDASSNKYYESIGLPTYGTYPIDDYRYFQRNFLTSLHLTHTISDNCYQDLTIGYNILNYSLSDHTPSYDGSYFNSESLYSKINARYFLFYDHSWSANIKTSITTGFEYSVYEMRNLVISTTSPLTNFFTASTPASAGAASFFKFPYSSTGYFAEAVTGFNNKLFLTTGFRYDVDPAYGDNIGGYAQPRVGLSYVVEQNKFKIKPRIVWGVSSTPPKPTYKTNSVNITTYSKEVIIGNPNIKPSRSDGYELGADIFYGNNYSLNITYYDQRIKDMIQQSFSYDPTTSPATRTYYYYNIGNAINRGLEVSAKAVIDPFTIDLSYTQTTSKWGNETGQTPDNLVYPSAPNLGIPKNSIYARLSYKLPSVLPWTAKGGRISLDWRYNGSAYNNDYIRYTYDENAWLALPDPKPAEPDFNNYFIWQKGYSYFNLRADYSVANYAALYIDVQNLLDKQGSLNGQYVGQFPGRRINFGFNLTF